MKISCISMMFVLASLPLQEQGFPGISEVAFNH